MIEQFETENSNGYSVAGRAALVGGTAYAGYSTFSEMKSNKPINPNNSNLRQTIGRLRNIRGQTGTGNKDIQAGPSFTDLLGNTREMREAQKLAYKQGLTPKMLSNMGFKSKGALATELRGFKGFLEKEGFTGLNVEYKMIGNHIGEIRIKGRYGNRNHSFKVNPVGADGTTLMGDNLQNKFMSRGILDPESLAGEITKDNLKVIDSDVALLRRYRSQINDFKRGVVNPHDVYKKMQNAILFEESNHSVNGISSAVGELRREQVVIDPFGDMSGAGKAAVMRTITAQTGWSAGSAAQYAKGILNSPKSILNRMIPGSGMSPTAYQLLRPSSFDGGVKPNVDWFDGIDAGVGEFTLAHVKDKNLLQAAIAHEKMGIGEIADEELIMNKSRNFMVKNEIYNAKVDLDGLSTKSSMGVFQKITDRLGLKSTQELGKVLSAPGGISSLGPEALSKLDFDINEDYRQLIEKKNMLLGRKQTLRQLPLSPEQYLQERRSLYDELRQTRAAMKEYEAFGVASDMARSTKLPAKELKNKIMNMSIDSNNNLSVAMQTHYRFGVGSKSFGAAKSTVKAEADTAVIMAQMEFFKASGRFGSRDEIKDLIPDFADVDFITTESPVKVVGNSMEARRMPNAVAGYISTAIAEGRTDELAKLGVIQKDGQYTLSEKDPRKLIDQIRQLNPDKNMDEIFSGTKRGMADIRISKALLSSDVHASQAGIGGAGTITERGMYYLEAMGLNKVTDDLYGRAFRENDVFGQIKTFTDAQDAKATVGVDALIGSGDLTPTGKSALFHANLDERSRVIERLGGKGTLTVDLGREIEGIRNVNIFSQQTMAPYVGTQIGSDDGITALDRAAQDLLQGAATGSGVSEEALAARALRYKEEQARVQESLSAAIAKAKIKGSMYGQAVSSLPGLDDAGRQLAREMGLGDDVIAPVIAMSKADIQAQFGDEAAELAMQGKLFGLTSREPIEGVHSVVTTQIRVAEQLAGGKLADELGDMRGRIFVANSPMLRKSLIVDFDKDTLNVLAVTGKEAADQLKGFMGLSGSQSNIAKEYYKSLQRMPYLDPKGGKSPVDALSTLDQELSGILSAQKQLEKGSIGIFSNEFKKIHVGLREQLAQGGDAAQYFKGEDFAHVFVENIIKSKHQSREALMKNEAMETLDLLGAKGKYARASLDERALRLQEIFDQLSYANKVDAQAVRQTGAMSLASDKEMIASGLEDMVGKFDTPDVLKAKAYAEVSDLDNIKNVLRSHSSGSSILSQGDYMWNAVTNGGGKPSILGAAADDAIATAKQFMSTAGSKMFKYAIAPAAIIGFASSLFSQPAVLKKSSAAHEVSDPTPETIDAGKTIFAIPESKVDNILIKGRANANTDFSALQAMGASNGGNYNASITDMRSKPDKYRIQELIDKGY